MPVKNEDGVSELLDETLIIALGLACAVVVGTLFFGFAVPIEKSAYVVPQFGTKDLAGKVVITAYDRGGDPVYFNATPLAKYRAAFYVDTTLGTYQAVPASTLTVFRPGDVAYLYYTGTGFVVTNTLTGAPVVTLPSGRVAVRLVDTYSGTLIGQATVVEGPVGIVTPANTTSTATPAATVTAAPTATVVPNVTTVIPTSMATATATATPTATTPATPTPTATASATKTITVKWSPSGYGYGSISPPTALFNSEEIKIPVGSSKTIYFVPNSNKAVLTIKLDGTTVYTGSSVGSTISYSVTNLGEDRTISATLG